MRKRILISGPPSLLPRLVGQLQAAGFDAVGAETADALEALALEAPPAVLLVAGPADAAAVARARTAAPSVVVMEARPGPGMALAQVCEELGVEQPPTAVKFLSAYAEPPPWDIGRPQRDVVALVEELGLQGSALDIGCGTGEHVLWFAARGVDAWGLDSTPEAIAAAEAKRDVRGLTATFVVGDALDLAAMERRFDAVLDCGLYHVLSEPERARYPESLAAVIPPGGWFVMLGFSDQEERGPPGFGPEEIRARFTEGWSIEVLRPARYETHMHEDGALAWAAAIRRTAT